ncbi:membrane-spanning 4-domains subfamily A member 4A isoform X2 [Pleuronectes platessa]|uniref:membrane-spanning 4-domains subfamily A member 4A isoform X2 n=1 Tax=Pleuronectes platessa TaxID=8262 RepID=UPI00232A3A28|nr:membrane-spanning 4-domains subfamily A member 4A isoform X2 [Pleuronectes platessa]
MSSSMYTTAEGVLVVTHVHPFPQGAPRGAGLPHCVGIQKFSKIHPYVLGTIQIMVGLTVMLFGVAMGIPAVTLTAFTGFWVWGALIYITAGSLTVAAGKHLTRCLVNTALGWCVVAAVCSSVGTILYFLDSSGVTHQCYYYYYNDQYYENNCMYQGRMMGLSGIMGLVNLLELIVSLVVAGIACKATCNCSGEVQEDSKNPQQPRAASVPEPPTYDSVLA